MEHELEQQRDFLLRSLDDLEAEHSAGGIDDDTYRVLHDDYTARAAATIRALRDGVDARALAPPAHWQRRVMVIGLIVVFAVGAGVALTAALGARLPGQTLSGNSGGRAPTTTGPSRRSQLEAAVASNPNDVASRLLLARALESDNDFAAALEQYDAVIARSPSSADAHAQAGRVLYLAATLASADQAAPLVDRAKVELDRSIEIDPDYADARFFRAIVRANEFGDFAGAQADVQRYLILAPNGTFVDQARRLLADVTKALESTSTTTG